MKTLSDQADAIAEHEQRLVAMPDMKKRFLEAMRVAIDCRALATAANAYADQLEIAAVVGLCDGEKMSVADIARRLHKSQTWVNRALERGRQYNSIRQSEEL